MQSYLLTWNPSNWPQTQDAMDSWLDLVKRMKRQTAKGNTVNNRDTNWSTGSRKNMAIGDRVFLLKQGPNPTGIMASGTVQSRVRTGKSWRTDSGRANYVDIKWDAWVEPDDVLSLSPYVRSKSVRAWLPRARASGIELTDQEQPLLEGLWRQHFNAICCSVRQSNRRGPDGSKSQSNGTATVVARAEVVMPDEISSDNPYYEGQVHSVLVNAYERSKKARNECIKSWGTSCRVCDMSFLEQYGRGKGFIHVHHRHPLGKQKRKYKVDPIKDLIPVCPNCHAVLHMNPSLTVEELRKRLQNRRKN